MLALCTDQSSRLTHLCLESLEQLIFVGDTAPQGGQLGVSTLLGRLLSQEGCIGHQVGALPTLHTHTHLFSTRTHTSSACTHARAHTHTHTQKLPWPPGGGPSPPCSPAHTHLFSTRAHTHTQTDTEKLHWPPGGALPTLLLSPHTHTSLATVHVSNFIHNYISFFRVRLLIYQNM